MFDRARRAAARQDAAHAAQVELDDRLRQAQVEQARAQQELDKSWALLTGNDPDTVLATLAEAFEDNEAPAAPVGIDARRTRSRHVPGATSPASAPSRLLRTLIGHTSYVNAVAFSPDGTLLATARRRQDSPDMGVRAIGSME